jgi:putative transposase
MKHMARKPRGVLLGQPGLYHAYSRFGAERPLFREPEAKKKFLEFLQIFCERYEVVLHGYCLMDDHFHVLCSIGPRTNLSRAVAKVKEMFSKWVHWRDHLSHQVLWGERFRVTQVENDACALSLVRCIENNPVRAGLVKNPFSYEFSSSSFHGKGWHEPRLCPLESYLALASTPVERQKIHQKRLLEESLGASLQKSSGIPWYQTYFIGSEPFNYEKLRSMQTMGARRMRTRKGRYSDQVYFCWSGHEVERVKP